MTPTPPDKDEIDGILDEYYAPIKIPDSNREGLKRAINRLIAEASIRELQNTMPHTDGMRHYNTVVKRIKELEQSLKNIEGSDDQ